MTAVYYEFALLLLVAAIHNVLIYVLLAAAVITALLGHWVDSGVIIGVVLINAVIGPIQERQIARSQATARSQKPNAVLDVLLVRLRILSRPDACE